LKSFFWGSLALDAVNAKTHALGLGGRFSTVVKIVRLLTDMVKFFWETTLMLPALVVDLYGYRRQFFLV
jgi:hypothetical protein